LVQGVAGDGHDRLRLVRGVERLLAVPFHCVDAREPFQSDTGDQYASPEAHARHLSTAHHLPGQGKADTKEARGFWDRHQ
jgi:hypothetical protein